MTERTREDWGRAAVATVGTRPFVRRCPMSPRHQIDIGHGATLHTSGCLCPPDRSDGPHRCIHTPTNWVHYDGAWYRSAVRSWHKARAIGRRCESWGQMVADLDLMLWPGGEQ